MAINFRQSIFFHELITPCLLFLLLGIFSTAVTSLDNASSQIWRHAMDQEVGNDTENIVLALI